MPVSNRALLAWVLVRIMACADGDEWHGEAAPGVCLLGDWLDPHTVEPLLPQERKLDTWHYAGAVVLQSRDAGSGMEVLGWNSWHTVAGAAGACTGNKAGAH